MEKTVNLPGLGLRPDPIIIPPIWRPTVIDLNCRSKILIVADSFLNYDPNDDFGLTEAVDIIRNASTTNHPIEVTTAHWDGDPNADVSGNFRFAGDHTVNGNQRSLSYYQEVWIFAAKNATSVANSMSGADLTAIEGFMDNGGGVFATGDHATLGAYLCGPIKRVGSMRYWYTSDGAPSGSNPTTRIDTNVPNGDVGAHFDLQSDNIAQRIYPKWYQDNGKTVSHELLQRHDVDGPITYLPDHAHEGIIVEPTSLPNSEYPGGLSPEIVAWGVSGGPGGSGKQPVTAKLFGVIGAYDGHQQNVGRVVVDSTWHHWVNVNLNGQDAGALPNGVPTDGLYDGNGNPTAEYEQIMDYFQNIAGWLEPNRLRICWLILTWPILRWKWPLVETIDLESKPNLDHMIELGTQAVEQLNGVRGATREELVSLLTQNIKLDESMDVFLNPRCIRSRERVKRLKFSPLMKRDALANAIIGSSIWFMAKELPHDVSENVDAVRKLLKIEGDKHDINEMFTLLTKGAQLGIELFQKELSRPSVGLTSFKRALR